MTRRNWLQLSAAGLTAPLLAQTASRPLLLPPVLKQGDAVGLITPATFVSDPEELITARRTVEYFGLRPVMGKNVAKRTGYVGGTIRERIDDLHGFFADPAIKGVFCIRGGYGSGQLLDQIDYELIRRNPKVLLGYSDITAMHLAIHQKTGLVTFHGPVALSRYTEYTQLAFKRALFQTEPIGSLTNPNEANMLRPNHTLRAVRPGTASGQLVGGNLSLVCALMGTPYEIDTRGKIVFLEDIGEQPYNIDRMLTQLRLAGKLQQAAGVIWGECNECAPRDYKPSFGSTFTTAEVVDQILGSLSVPVLSGLTIGHTSDQLTLPLGTTARLDADRGTLSIESPATRS